MSSFIEEANAHHIYSVEDLAHYFHAFSTMRQDFRVGIETEFLGVFKDTGQALPYEGAVGIHAVLKCFAKDYGYEPLFEGDAIIALKRDETMITLEPGGQVELSAPPKVTLFDIETQINEFVNQLRHVRTQLPGMDWLAVGLHPFSTLEEIEWVPKKRYGIMSRRFETAGTLSHHMMKRTATNQVSFDYENERDAMEGLRVVLALTSLVSGLFSNSGFSEGQPNGFINKRIDIWNHTDPSRSGLIVDFTERGLSFQHYLDYLLDMPMLFIIRDEKWVEVKGKTFRDFIQQGYEGAAATLDDFVLHMSTAFPEVRIKQYIEVRGADCQNPAWISGVAALWKGILYDSLARSQAWCLVEGWTPEERLQLHQQIAKSGLEEKFKGQDLWELVSQLVELSQQGLARQSLTNQIENEAAFLKPIQEHLIQPRKTPTQTFLDVWKKNPQMNPSEIVSYFSIG